MINNVGWEGAVRWESCPHTDKSSTFYAGHDLSPLAAMLTFAEQDTERMIKRKTPGDPNPVDTCIADAASHCPRS